MLDLDSANKNNQSSEFMKSLGQQTFTDTMKIINKF